MLLEIGLTVGQPDEVSIIDDLQMRQMRGERPNYLDVYSPYEMGAQNMEQLPEPHYELLLRACQKSETRLQGIRPTDKGYYFDHHKEFINNFIKISGNSILDTEHVLIIGPKVFADQLIPYVLARRATIVKVSGKEPEKFVVFLGCGEIMESQFRSIGSSQPPYAYAITGALDCYLNTDYIEPGGAIYDPAVIRAAWHEPAHVMWNSVLGKDMALEDIILHEMLAGPLDPRFWSDIDMPYRMVDPVPLLRRDITYQDWFSEGSRLNGCVEQYFNHPLAKELTLRAKDLGYALLYYHAVTGQGDALLHFNRAR